MTVPPSGTKSFVLMYYVGERKKRLTLGRYPVLSLTDARRRALDHTTGTLGGVAGIYNRFRYLPEMREGLELWAQHVEKLSVAPAK